MSTQGERIRQVRKYYGLTLDKFGEKLGLKKSALSQLENGLNSVSEVNLKAICREYNVDYTWLTTGIGNMLIDSDDTFMAKIDAILTGEDDNFKNLFRIMVDFSDEEIQFINSMIDKIIALKEEQNKN